VVLTWRAFSIATRDLTTLESTKSESYWRPWCSTGSRYSSSASQRNIQRRPTTFFVVVGQFEMMTMDFTSASTRSSFASLPAYIFVILLLLSPLPSLISSSFKFSIPEHPPWHHLRNAINLFKEGLDIIKAQIKPFLTLSDAEALDSSPEYPIQPESRPIHVPLWRTMVLSFTALVLTLIWLSYACYALLVSSSPMGKHAILISLTWLYATIYPILRPSPTPPYSLFTLYILHFIGGVLLLGGVLYDAGISGVPVDATAVFALVVNLLAIIGLLSIVLAMPVGIPSDNVDVTEIVSLALELFPLFLTTKLCIGL
jgi:hypothetical protein